MDWSARSPLDRPRHRSDRRQRRVSFLLSVHDRRQQSFQNSDPDTTFTFTSSFFSFFFLLLAGSLLSTLVSFPTLLMRESEMLKTTGLWTSQRIGSHSDLHPLTIHPYPCPTLLVMFFFFSSSNSAAMNGIRALPRLLNP